MTKPSYKFMLLGPMAVGKTSLAKRSAYGAFSDDYKSTIGVQLFKVETDDANIVLWDTDGEAGASLLKSPYMAGAKAALIVADCQRMETIKSQLSLAETYAELFPNRPFICVLNKVDVAAPPADLVLQIEKRGWLNMRTSAKENIGVLEALSMLTEALLADDT